MNSRITLTLSALICLGTATSNAMDETSKVKKSVSQEVINGAKTYKAVTKMTVVPYDQVVTQGVQVVKLKEVKALLINQHEQQQYFYRRYPITTLLCVGGACFTLGLFFPEIRDSVTNKLAAGAENSGQ